MAERPRIWVAGHRGLVGSAIVRRLEQDDAAELVLRTHAELDLTDRGAVEAFLAEVRPTHVFLAAAKVGGIRANDSFPAEFIHENLAIQDNVIHGAWVHDVEKLCFLGSSCIYPKFAPQPISEDSLLTGPLEPTNEWYAIAKIAGLKTCQAYRRQYGFRAFSLMPTNLYGPGDNFDPETSHVLPALVHKFHRAKERGAERIELWGTGTARREFLHVDDLADAAVALMDRYEEAGPINVGTGEDVTIAELAELVRGVVGFEGRIEFDRVNPDGTPRKLLDVSKIHDFGWRHRIGLEAGIRSTYDWYLANVASA
ncbi:MAG: GDP-L-fucose synthase [Pseudomonadales bacterium]|jgi:GDP-L-fucose synthase|nr:GDP-L-fucose synthase [Pseudomonadales bacterium]